MSALKLFCGWTGVGWTTLLIFWYEIVEGILLDWMELYEIGWIKFWLYGILLVWDEFTIDGWIELILFMPFWLVFDILFDLIDSTGTGAKKFWRWRLWADDYLLILSVWVSYSHRLNYKLKIGFSAGHFWHFPSMTKGV